MSRPVTATLRIVGRDLPGMTCGQHRNVHLGIQRRREVIDVVPGDAKSVVFEAAIDVVPVEDSGLDYRGPYAQGPRGARFVYLSWGDVDADGVFTMFGRAKLNLFSVPDKIAQAMADGRTVEATLRLTGRKGGPLCASIAADVPQWSVED